MLAVPPATYTAPPDAGAARGRLTPQSPAPAPAPRAMLLSSSVPFSKVSDPLDQMPPPPVAAAMVSPPGYSPRSRRSGSERLGYKSPRPCRLARLHQTALQRQALQGQRGERSHVEEPKSHIWVCGLFDGIAVADNGQVVVGGNHRQAVWRVRGDAGVRCCCRCSRPSRHRAKLSGRSG